MAVKDGLPATDFSRKNREWVKNVVDGTTVPDGLPATDLSRMNREWVKAVVDEAGGGGDITVESLTVTENDTYTAPEGKAYSPVIVNVPAGAKVVASGTITGSNSHSIEINVGEEMPSQNFLLDIYAADDSEFPSNTNYNMVSFFYLHSDEFGPFAFASAETGYDKYDFSAKKYNVNNDGTITEVNVKPGASFDTVRQTTVNQGGYGTPVIRKYSDHFSIFWQRGNAQYVFPNTITYNFRVIYFGSDWDSDKLTL